MSGMTDTPIPLLIVDDDPPFVALLVSMLDIINLDAPFATHCVDTAPAALAEIKRHRYDLVLLDNKLPGADGLDVLTDIARLPPDQQPAVIMLTATGNEAIAVEAMKRGAKDYLSKLDIGLPALTRAISSALARHRLEREVRVKTEQLTEDLRLAREIQEAFLPQHYPPFRDNALRFSHRYRPTTEVGGDFFDILPLSDTAAGVFICDVMGHGLRAALVTAILRGLVEELMPLAGDPGRFLTEVNRGLHGVLKQTRRPLFTSAYYLVADAAAGQLRFANAGHPSPLHLRRTAGTVTPLPSPAPAEQAALALFADHVYPTLTTPLAPRDGLLLFTDGLYEVAGADGELFGEDRLLATVRQQLALPADALCDQLLGEIQQYAAHHQFTDDVCLVGIEVGA